METKNMIVNNQTVTNTKTLKCKPGQGKLNRLTKNAQAVLASLGHTPRRFKRDYNSGTATYTCPNCNATAVATVVEGHGNSAAGGAALFLRCSVVNS